MESELRIEHIVRLFSRMTHLFAHRWTSVYGPAMSAGQPTAAAKQWLYDLRDYTPEQVARGMQAVVDRRLEWPPGPLEFMSLCDGIPSVSELLDLSHDYGPVCARIRKMIDWYNLDGMPSCERRRAAEEQIERAVVSLRRSGELKKLSTVPQLRAVQHVPPQAENTESRIDPTGMIEWRERPHER